MSLMKRTIPAMAMVFCVRCGLPAAAGHGPRRGPKNVVANPAQNVVAKLSGGRHQGHSTSPRRRAAGAYDLCVSDAAVTALSPKKMRRLQGKLIMPRSAYG